MSQLMSPHREATSRHCFILRGHCLGTILYQAKGTLYKMLFVGIHWNNVQFLKKQSIVEQKWDLIAA